MSATLSKQVQRWARRRQGADILPLALTRRRVYILPTGFGWIYSVLVLAMLLGSMNYNNSLGFGLTFLLASLGLVAMHHCHRNLAGLRIDGLQAGETFAGDAARLSIGCENTTAIERFELLFECTTHPAPSTVPAQSLLAHMAPASRTLLTVELPTTQRGPLRLERIAVSTRFPFGLFRAWSWVYPGLDTLVYPRPAGTQIPPPAFAQHRPGPHDSKGGGSEDFRGFREYQRGDSPRHIAWKALARGAPLLVREHSGAERQPAVFDFEQAAAPETEARLSQLCQWILQADRSGGHFGLRLPNRYIAPGAGAAHRRDCLSALARFGHRP